MQLDLLVGMDGGNRRSINKFENVWKLCDGWITVKFLKESDADWQCIIVGSEIESKGGKVMNNFKQEICSTTTYVL